MRFLVLSNLYPPAVLGGYELVCEGVVDRLRASGHRVVVLTSAGDPAPGQEHVRRELSFYLRNGRPHQPHPLLRLPRERADHRALQRAGEWDAALVFHAFGLAKSLLTRLHERGPVGYTLGDTWPAWDLTTDTWLGRLHPAGPPGTPNRGVRRLRYPSLVARSIAPLARAAGIPTEWPDLFRDGSWWAGSQWILDQLRERGLPISGRVIPHGIPLDLFPLRLPREPRGRLLYVGRISEAKGVRVALDALELLPEASLTLVGPVDPGFADTVPLPDRAMRIPPVPRSELASIYADHDALVFPSTWSEGFGLVPLEAMAVGLPVVATGTGGSSEHLTDGSNCLLVEPGAPESIASAVRRLLADGDLRRRLIAEGRETAERLSIERTAEEIESAATDLVTGQRSAHGPTGCRQM